jgi:hypothetical protein
MQGPAASVPFTRAEKGREISILCSQTSIEEMTLAAIFLLEQRIFSSPNYRRNDLKSLKRARDVAAHLHAHSGAGVTCCSSKR